jgi:hypothetical protein
MRMMLKLLEQLIVHMCIATICEKPDSFKKHQMYLRHWMRLNNISKNLFEAHMHKNKYMEELEKQNNELQERLAEAETLLHSSVTLSWYRLPKNENRWDWIIAGIPNMYIATITRMLGHYQLSWSGPSPIFVPSNYLSLKQAQDEAWEILKASSESYIKIA